MQTSQVKKEFPKIERYIGNAAGLCQSSSNVPEELRDRLSDLEKESGEAASMLKSESDKNKIVECVDKLESLGDRALQACNHASNVDSVVQKAVQQAHDALSDLKHRLH
jgi:hypothetical protein